MIIKRIRESALRKRRSLQGIEAVVKALTTYAIDAEPELLEALASENRAANYVLDVVDLGVEPGEKVEFHGTRNLFGKSLIQHQQQMLSACILVPNATDPLEHYVISWRKGERPSRKQVEEVVTIFCVEMGYERSHVVWAVHSNTAQWHLHIVASRINLLEGKIVTPGGGWEIDRLHQVIALVEDRQGWSSEKGAIYFARQGVVYDRETKRIMRRADGSRDSCYKRKATSPEKGQAPEHRKILRALESATSWRDLHYRLAQEGAAYVAKASGAEIRIAAERMRASHFGREFAFGKMEVRLGPYEPDPFRETDPHESYQAALRDERTRLREALKAAREELHRRRELALKHARRRQQNRFLQEIVEERIQLAFDQVEERIKHEFDRVRRTISASYRNRDRWYQAGQPPAVTVSLPEIIYAGYDPRDRDVAEEHGLASRQHAAGAEYLDKWGERALSDYGVILLVHQNDLAVVEVALSLASRRADSITVSGSPAFLELCREAGRSRGFNLVDDKGQPLNPPANPGRDVREAVRERVAATQVGAQSVDRDIFDLPTRPISPAAAANPWSPSAEETLADQWAEYQDRSSKGR